MRRVVMDSTGIEIGISPMDVPADQLKPRRLAHPPKRAYQLDHKGFAFGEIWTFVRVNKGEWWAGRSNRTSARLGDFQNEESAIGAVVIDALRRNEQFARLTHDERSAIVLPSIRSQRDTIFHRLVADLGGGLEARKIAQAIRANREAVERWILAAVEIDQRASAEKSRQLAVRKTSKAK